MASRENQWSRTRVSVGRMVRCSKLCNEPRLTGRKSSDDVSKLRTPCKRRLSSIRLAFDFAVLLYNSLANQGS